MSTLLDERSQLALKRHIFSTDAAVQTDNVMISASSPSAVNDDLFQVVAKSNPTDEDVINNLTAADLASILKWNREISRDINLSLTLQRLTEIVTGRSFISDCERFHISSYRREFW
jgi:hypothetical protein